MATIGVVGLGLMGSSFAMALKKAQPDITIVGSDYSAATVRKAMDREVVTAAGTDLGAIEMADVVVIAVPILAMRDVLDSMRGYVQGKVVTDMASTKGSIMEWAAGAGVELVGGHPMCGREAAGIDGADAELFKGAPWILTRDDPTVRGLVESVGAHPLVMDAATHDRLVAGVSHAALLLRENLLEQLDAISASLTRLRRHLEADDPRLVELFEEARAVRERWSAGIASSRPTPQPSPHGGEGDAT